MNLMATEYVFALVVVIAAVGAFLVWDQRRLAKEVTRAADEQRPFPAVPYKAGAASTSVSDGGGGSGCGNDGGGGDGCS